MEPEKKANGALVGLIIIIIILLAGVLYMWQTSRNAELQEHMEVEESENVVSEDSSDLDSLEADLQTTDTSTGVDANTVY